MKDYKKYLKFVNKEDDYYFETAKGDTLRFAGGGNGKRKFIIESLCDLYGEKEGVEIFTKFLEGLDNIKNISDYKENTGVLVLYPKINVFDQQGPTSSK